MDLDFEAAFISAALTLLIVGMWMHIVVQSFRTSLPLGERVSRLRGGCLVHVVTSDPIFVKADLQDLAENCSLAFWCATSEWARIVNRNIQVGPREICVHILSGGEYAVKRPAHADSHGYLTKVPAFFGNGVPMIVVNTKSVKHIQRVGEPVIREILRICAAHGKPDDKIWNSVDGLASVQSQARLLYNELRSWN